MDMNIETFEFNTVSELLETLKTIQAVHSKDVMYAYNREGTELCKVRLVERTLSDGSKVRDIYLV